MVSKLKVRFSFLFVALAVLLAMPAMAWADTLQVNDVGTNGNVSKNAGASGTAKVWLVATDGTQGNPDANGCNVTATRPATVNLTSSNTAVIPNPGTTSLTACGVGNAKTIPYSVSSTAAANSVVTITATVTQGGVASSKFSTGSFTVTVAAPSKQNQSITFDQSFAGVKYGDSVNLTATASSGLPVSYSASGNCAVASGTLSATGAGTCTVTASQDGGNNYNAAAPVARTFDIAKADLTVNTDNKEKVYGDANPAFTGNIVGIKNGDAITANRSTTATQSSGVGTYPITATLSDPDGKLGNYNATNNGGTLTINKATATLSLSDLEQTFDGSPKAATVTTDPAGLSGVKITYDGSETAPINAGSYAVVASLTNDNYTAQDATGTLLIAAAPASIAGKAVGPVDPQNGFPFWYQDENGTRLDLCLDPNDQMCLQPFDGFDYNQPMSFPENFPQEAFWWAGDASMPTNNGGDALLGMALEAAFTNGTPKAGDQASFGRVRIWVDNLEAGKEYKVTYPYGTKTYVAQPVTAGSSVGRIRDTLDVGCFGSALAPCKFDQNDPALSSKIGPFLMWDPAVEPQAPEGYLGDPNIEGGHKVVGSPITDASGNPQNYFRVEGPNVGGPGVDMIQTEQFTISGKIAVPQASPTLKSGTYNEVQSVKLVKSDPSYDVYYTMSSSTDGTEPADPADPTTASDRYAGAISIGQPGTRQNVKLKYVAVDPATGKMGPVKSASYTIDAVAPAVSAAPAPGTYDTPQDVSLTALNLQEGETADIFYTLDGSDPSDANNQARTKFDAANPIAMKRSGTIKAVAVDSAGNQSQVKTFDYTIASLAKTGPINPQGGFPFWYEDANGTRLDLCLDPQDQKCLQPFEINDPNAPVSFPDNFPAEAFWWAGDASMPLDSGGNATLVLAQEAAFTNGVPRDGEQDSFARVRIRVGGLQVGQKYRVSQPYGTEVYTATDDGKGGGQIRVVSDIGCFGGPGTPCNFDAARFGDIGPFLTWTTFGNATDNDPTTVPDPALMGPNGEPDAYVGDPAVEGGHEVKGSPVTDASGNPQNYFKIEQLNADGTATQIGFTDKFTIAGKVSKLQVGASKTGGSYKAPQNVLLRASDPNATIYYTTDLSEPTTSSPNHFVGEGTVPVSDTTLKFMAVDAAGNTSQVYTETYSVDTAAPTLSANPQSGSYPAPQDVTLTASEPAKIYYTKGATGSQIPNPTEQSTLFSSPIHVDAPTTIKAIAIDHAGNRSEVTSFDYDVAIPPAAPSDPVQNLRALDQLAVKSPLADSALPVTINWGASRSGTVTSYQLQQSTNGGAFTDVAPQPGTANSTILNLAMGTTAAPNSYQFRVRACDGPACSAWSTGPNFTLRPVDEPDLKRISYNGTWTQQSLPGSYGGTVRYASTAKDKVTLNKFSFRVNGNFAWVSTFGPNRGRASVSVDGGPAQTVDLYSPTLQPAKVAFATNNLAAGTEHTITIQVLGTKNAASSGTRVDLDAFVTIF